MSDKDVCVCGGWDYCDDSCKKWKTRVSTNDIGDLTNDILGDGNYTVASDVECGRAANLIAAAPDMYRALEDVLSDLEIGAHPHLRINEIRAALAKAEGQG